MKTEVVKKNFTVADGVTAILKLKDREPIIEIEDISDPTLGVAVRHLYVTETNGNGYVGRWCTNLEERLVLEASGKWVYTNTMGERFVFTEAFYRLDADGTRVLTPATKSDVSADSTGRLWYGEAEVFRVLYTDDGHRATTRLADINNAEWLEQRYDEEAEVEETLTSLEETLCAYMAADDLGNQLDRITTTMLASPDQMEAFFSKTYSWTEGDDDTVHRGSALFFASEEALSYRSLCEERDRLEAITYRSENENQMLENTKEQINVYLERSEKNKKQLRAYYTRYCGTKANADVFRDSAPVAFLYNGDSARGFNKDGRLVTLHEGKSRQLVVEWQNFSPTGERKVSALCDDKDNRMVFRYDEDGTLAEIENSQGACTKFTYENGRLVGVTRPYLSTLDIRYTDFNITSIVSDGRDIGTLTYAYDNTLGSLIRTTTVSHISHGNIAEGNAETPIEVEKIRFVYEYGSSIYYDTEHKKERYSFSSSNPGHTYHFALHDGKLTAKEHCNYNSQGHLSQRTLIAPVCHGQAEEGDYVMGDTENYTYNVLGELLQSITCHYPVEGQSAGLETKTIVDYTYKDGKTTCVKTTLEEYYGESAPTKTTVSYELTAYNSAGKPVRTESYTEGKETLLGKDVSEIIYDDEGKELRRFSYNTLSPSDKTYTESETDAKGYKLFDLDATGKHKTSYTYFADGSLASEQYPNGGTLAYAYDKEGNTVSVTASTADGEGNTNVTHYTAGLVTRVESGNHVVDYEYDGKRRLTKVKLDGSDYETYSYTENTDGSETVSTAYAEDAPVTTTTKDKQKNTVGYVFDGVMDVAYSYTADGRITRSYDSVSARERGYSYDDERRLSEYTDNRGIKEGVTYDEKGRVSTRSETVDEGAATAHTANVTFTYDDIDRVSMFETVGFKVTPTLDAMGRARKTEVMCGNRFVQEASYRYLKHGDHTTSIPQEIKYYGASDDECIKYFYDEMGNISKITENGVVASRYEYDALGRLTREDNRAFGKSCTWEYDANGNILFRREWEFSLQPTSKLEETEPITTVPYLYEGDLLWSYAGSNRFRINKYNYYTKYNGKILVWTGGRYLKKFGGMNITYAGDSLCASINERPLYYDRNGRLIADDTFHYLYDHTDELLGFVNKATPEDVYFYRRDAQGNIRAILDNRGGVVVQYKYDAWGNHLVLDDAGAVITDTTNIGYLNPFRYRGYYYSQDLGLYYLKSRFYDPVTSRFISPDATSYLAPDVINGLNLYAYCNNNPVMNVDPEGHAWWEWLVAVAVVVVCAVAAVATAGASLVVSAALAGAAVGGGVSVASQAVDVARNGGDFSWGKFAAGAATGAAIGMLGAGAINAGLALANSLPQAGGLLATTAGTTVGGAISATGAIAGAGVLAGLGIMFSKHNPGMSNRAPFSWTNNQEGLDAMRKNNMDANKAANDIMNNHFESWKTGAGQKHNAVKKWLDRVIRKMIQGGK